MKNVVVDASVLLRDTMTRLSAGDANRFAGLLRAIDAGQACGYVLTLTAFEINNAARYEFDTTAQVKNVYQKFLNLPLQEFEMTGALHQRTIELAFQLGTTIYDTSYHVAALALGGEFWTCDAKYYAKAQSQGSIVLLE